MKLWTDGGCHNLSRAKQGGWAFVVEGEDGGVAHRSCGWALGTTSNRMELTAAIKGLAHAKHVLGAGKIVIVHSDSQYVVDGASGWAKNWRRNGWITSSGGDVVNRDLWEDLLELDAKMMVLWKWVRGHAGAPLNEEADRLCTRATRRAIWRDQRGRGLV